MHSRSVLGADEFLYNPQSHRFAICAFANEHEETFLTARRPQRPLELKLGLGEARMPNFKVIASALAVAVVGLLGPARAADLAEVQAALAELGHTPGPADGKYGRRTDQALRELFRQANIAFDGTLDGRRAQFVLDFRDFMRRDTDLLVGLVTRQVEPSSLTDAQICDTLRVLPLRPTFEVAQARGLACDLAVRLDLDLPRRYLGLEELEEYAARNGVAVPDFSLEDVPPVYPDLGATRVAFGTYNKDFSLMLEDMSRQADFAFCRAWLPTVRHVMPDPSKNLDGTGSWREETLRDAQVYCQDGLHFLVLAGVGTHPGAAAAVAQFQGTVEAWVAADAPRNLYLGREGANTNFPYILMLNQITSGVELLRAGFTWGPEEDARYAEWARRRVDDIHPYELNNPAGAGYCGRPTDGTYMSDECMNAAALAAQVTLRVGILAKSPELVRRAYLTFHRYLSAVRPDGSPAFDSMRGCYAAGYVSWAAMFSDAFLLQWGRISQVDWDLSVNGGGTLREMFEYALRVVDSPNDVNEYARVHRYGECYDAAGNLRQRLGEDPLQFYSTYLAAHDPERLKSLIGQTRDKYGYSRGGGPNYEAVNLMALAGLPKALDPADYAEDRHAGRYRMAWQFYNDGLGRYETTAMDTLTLSAGRGGIELGKLMDHSMGPSDVFRRGLQVTYAPDGAARAEGLLNYWCCDSPAEVVQLAGDLDGGVLTDGRTEGGRRYKILLRRLPD